MREVGVVLSRKPPTQAAFEFELREPGLVGAGDYVEVPCERGAIVARVLSIRAENDYFAEVGLVREHAEYGLRLPSGAALEAGEVHVARAEVVGVVREDGSLEPPLVPPSPGSLVYAASKLALTTLLGLSTGPGVRIGEIWRLGVEVVLDPERLLRHHVAVLGATGTGKSYTCGVLAEELLELGMPVVVLDPHGEYRTLAERYRARCVKATQVALEPGFVSPDAIAEATDMTEVQRDLLFLAYRRMEGPTLGDLERAVEEVAGEYGFRRETLVAMLRRLETLRAMGLFTGKGERLAFEEGECVVVDVGVGLSAELSRALVGAIVWDLFERRKCGEVPPFALIVDEAHRYLPVDAPTFCSKALRTVAREGRKFGACLIIASQRVVGLDKDVLSQCGTKIVLRMDSPTDLAMLKPLLGAHTKLLPHLPNGVALLAGVAVRYPVLVKIRERRTPHGGAGVSLPIKASHPPR